MSVNPFSLLLNGLGYGLNSLLDAMPDQFYIKDAQGRFVFVNTATARFWNRPAVELIGKTDQDLFPRSLADQFQAEEKELLTSGRPVVNREACLADPATELRWEVTTKIALRDDRGQIIGLLGVNRDITDRKRMEADTRRVKEEWERTFDAVPDLIAILDRHHIIRRVNRAMAAKLGLTPEQAVGQACYQCVHGLTAVPAFCPHAQLLNDQQEHSVEIHEDRLGGDFLVTCTPLHDKDGQSMGSVQVARDITASKRAQAQLQQLNADLARSQLELLETYENLKRTQAQLIQSEKLEMVGRLAAGIAHEVRNPLAILAMGLGYIEGNLPPNQPGLDTVLGNMHDSIVRADAIIGELLDFSSPRVLELTDQDVTKLAERSLLLVKHELRRRKIEVVREFAAGLPVQRVDRIRIEQVFVNLFMNAIHAMADGGRLTIRLFRNAAGVVVVEICDTGEGIPAAHLEKVFDPFFTTKPVGIGTGLGLAVAKSILTQHGGDLTLVNQSGGGVCARLIFHNAKMEANHGT